MLTAELDNVYDAVEKAIADTEITSLSYEAVAIRHADWGVPGQGLTVFVIKPSPEVLGFQAKLLAAVTLFLGSTGTSAAFVRNEGETISHSTMDWVDGYVPNQIGEKYIAHVTVGFATLEDLKGIEAEPFERLPRPPRKHRRLPPRQQRHRSRGAEVLAVLAREIDERAGPDSVDIFVARKVGCWRVIHRAGEAGL